MKVVKIRIEPMTAESFAPFGELIDPQGRPPDERIISDMDYHEDGRTTLSALWQPYQGLTFSELERHFGVVHAGEGG